MQRLEEANGDYPAGTEWADPDLDAAAEMMRAVVADPTAAKARATRAAADIGEKLSPLAVARRIEERVTELAGEGRLGVAAKAGANPPGAATGIAYTDR
jgi:hypothetical protein